MLKKIEIIENKQIKQRFKHLFSVWRSLKNLFSSLFLLFFWKEATLHASVYNIPLDRHFLEFWSQDKRTVPELGSFLSYLCMSFEITYRRDLG